MINNFRKYCAFYYDIRSQLRALGGGGARVDARPLREKNIFYLGRGNFFPCGENLRLVFIYTNFRGAHALAALIDANLSTWGKLRKFVRHNRLIHFGANFYMLKILKK